MLRRGGVRRAVGAILVATMFPWFTGCHKQVPVSLAPGRVPIGTRLLVRSTQVLTVRATSAVRAAELFTDVEAVEGVLLMATSDSLRLGSPVLTHAGGRRSQGFREATFAATPGLTASRAEIAKARTAAVGGTVGLVVGLALVFVVMVVRCRIDSGAGGC